MGDVKEWAKNPAVNGLLTLLLILCWYLHTEATGRIKELERSGAMKAQKIAVVESASASQALAVAAIESASALMAQTVAVQGSEIKQLRRIADKMEDVPAELASIKTLIKEQGE